MLHRIDDCWEDISSWEFWKLVNYLPAYEGATKAALSAVAQINAGANKSREPSTPEGATEVPAELINSVIGSDLISWGKGGG